MNKLTKPKLLSKTSYYRDEFVANKNDKSKLWQTVNSLLNTQVNMTPVCKKLEVYSKITDDSKATVEKLNKHFCPVDVTIADSIDKCSRIDSKLI